MSHETTEQAALPRPRSFWRNILKYTVKRLLLLALTVASAVYITIIIANYGGYLDVIVNARIDLATAFLVQSEPLASMSNEERLPIIEQMRAEAKQAAGLNDPFFLRTLRWLDEGLRLDWGRPTRFGVYATNTRAATVGQVIQENLARTLLVFGLANLLLFVVSVFLGLVLVRRRGGRLDRAFVLLSPFSSAPAWVYGVLLAAFFLRVFGYAPGGAFDSWEGGLTLTHLRVILRNLALPFLAIFLAGLFQTVYTWRSFFHVYSEEDYVHMARARGFSAARIDLRYIMRPALPGLLTRFGLLLAVLWQEIIALEYFFNVQGLGRLFYAALNGNDIPMIVAIVTTFAYLVALTVFLLDMSYVLVDPRVLVGSDVQRGSLARATGGGRWSSLRSLFAGRPALRPRLPFRLALPRPNPGAAWNSLRNAARWAVQTAAALRRFPSAVAGLLIILGLIGVSIYTVVAIPYQEAVTLWRGDGGVWERNPNTALPQWVNLFRRRKLPPTLSFSSAHGDGQQEVVALDGGWHDVTIPFSFEYNYAGYPQDIVVDLAAAYEARGPHITLAWIWPDGSEQELTSFRANPANSYFVSGDERLQRRLRSDRPRETLFQNPAAEGTELLPGTYTLVVNALLFEPDTEIDVDVTLIGQVYGLAGTDANRRDLMIALLWGTPVALGFGIIAAFATSVGGMLIAALGAWYGGAVDRVVQYLTEVNLILPFFPVSLMIFVMYSRSIITILAVTVALTLFGSAVKSYRTIFLQLRDAPYVEAARAYGASDWRIVVRYLVPRIMALLIPRIIFLVPGYVFLEATLAFLGISDPLLPTWGKLIVAALSFGVHAGATHLVLAPLGVLFLTGFAFGMVGLALEQILDPQRNIV